MNLLTTPKTRRRFLCQSGLGAALLAVPGAFAEILTRTPRQTEGPFYPNHLPLDTDNDLIVVNNSITPAVGTIAYVSGRILDARGEPVRNALVEIWQCDNNGVYLHTADTANRPNQDKHFQGFGRFLTGTSGEYLFRTIKPVPYEPRTPHIHFKIRRGDRELLTTQCYIRGHPDNERDFIWRSVSDPRKRDAITVDFAPLPEAEGGEVAARFDIVLGWTPEG